MRQPVEAVIFDFGGVLCHVPREQDFLPLAEALGTPVDRFQEVFWSHRVAYDQGMQPLDYWNAVAADLGVALNGQNLARLLEADDQLWQNLDPRPLDWADRRRREGIRIGLLSNLPSPLGEVLRSMPGFMERFDHYTFSYELGVVKPYPEIYEHSIRGAGTQPERTLFLDDRLDNVAGAKFSGLMAEKYTTWDDFSRIAEERYSFVPAVARRQ